MGKTFYERLNGVLFAVPGEFVAAITLLTIIAVVSFVQVVKLLIQTIDGKIPAPAWLDIV